MLGFDSWSGAYTYRAGEVRILRKHMLALYVDVCELEEWDILAVLLDQWVFAERRPSQNRRR
jgi:hypothetical protein